jgi:hypothetical protein
MDGDISIPVTRGGAAGLTGRPGTDMYGGKGERRSLLTIPGPQAESRIRLVAVYLVRGRCERAAAAKRVAVSPTSDS